MNGNLHVICTDNSGFEDQLKLGVSYLVEEMGENSYFVSNEKEVIRPYGQMHFCLVV